MSNKTKWVKVQVPDDFDEDVVSANGQDFPLWNPDDNYIKLLDHGYIGLVDFMGDDSSIIRSARVSYGKGTKKTSTDRNLLRYLMRNRHSTPMEMCEFTFHVKAPIFVFRQWHRHRAGVSINEYSARYSLMEDDMYMPSPEHMKPQSSDNKQGRTNDELSDQNYKSCWTAIEQVFEDSYTTYKHLLGTPEGTKATTLPDILETRKKFLEDAAMQGLLKMQSNAEVRGEEIIITNDMISEKISDYMEQQGFATVSDDFSGIAKELARIVLPVAAYSQMYWKCDLRNIFHFIGLRSDPHAQYEIRTYSDAMLELIKPHVPWAVEAFLDYQFNATSLSDMERSAVQVIMDSAFSGGLEDDLRSRVEQSLIGNGCSKREVTEFMDKFETPK